MQYKYTLWLYIAFGRDKTRLTLTLVESKGLRQEAEIIMLTVQLVLLFIYSDKFFPLDA
jgi:hypothetical protein